jgi:iron transport multicopper oxidase
MASVDGRRPGDPASTIYAAAGETLAVDVRNELASGGRASSVHWHGMYQQGTPYMDGVPGVSFCGILPGQSFRYEFTASPAGTHWYHSHSGGQYADGLAGALVVRPAPDAELPAWESAPDLEEEVLLAMEWPAASAETEFAKLSAGQNLGGTYKKRMLADVAWPEWLLNGEPGGNATFRLKPGTTTRFRFINGGANYLVVLRAEGLPMRLVMTDPGQYVEPTRVDAIRAAIGERYDFLVEVPAGAEARAYRLTLSDEIGVNTAVVGTVLVGSAEAPNPLDTSAPAGPPPPGGGEVSNTYGFPPPWRGQPAPPPSREVRLTLSGSDDPYQWGIGNVSLEEPSVPLMLSRGRFGYKEDRMTLEKIGVGEVVDLVFVNPTMMGHPFHLHGNDFWVMETWGKFPGSNVTASDPPQRRDTVQVPPKGGARIRVRSENPGPWLCHCHVDFHLMAGMALVVQVGAPGEWPRPPAGATPVCGGAPGELLQLAREAPDLFL